MWLPSVRRSPKRTYFLPARVKGMYSLSTSSSSTLGDSGRGRATGATTSAFLACLTCFLTGAAGAATTGATGAATGAATSPLAAASAAAAAASFSAFFFWRPACIASLCSWVRGARGFFTLAPSATTAGASASPEASDEASEASASESVFGCSSDHFVLKASNSSACSLR